MSSPESGTGCVIVRLEGKAASNPALGERVAVSHTPDHSARIDSFGTVVGAFSLNDLEPSSSFDPSEHAELIAADFDSRRAGPIVEISFDGFGTVALKMFWSAATIVMFALQPLRLSLRLQDPTLDADGNLVMLLSRFDRTPVDAATVRNQLLETGFQVGEVDTPPPW
ncbi:hypothetical protein JOE59_002777 [Agromyces cerinus]|uniref:hypothetical protein n=1 Tax=Agromyces cerinus TaxID=33878 RepID=UPI00195D0BC5|nr:hypothetical protein [Agromyces cerinus]MBM7832072.1 hypothetical protein [Agromyces cerinus]